MGCQMEISRTGVSVCCLKCSLFLYQQVLEESGPTLLPVFASMAPLHSRKHQEFKLSDDQTSFRLEICEGYSLEDAVTVARVSTGNFPSSCAKKILPAFEVLWNKSLKNNNYQCLICRY